MPISKSYYIIPILIVSLFLYPGKSEISTSLFCRPPETPPSTTISGFIRNSAIPNSFHPDTHIITYDSIAINKPADSPDRDSLPVFNYRNLKNYIFSNLYYPLEAQEKGIEGEVHVHFSVLKDGTTTHIRIAKPVHPLLDSAALLLIQSMPRWMPFIQKPIPDSLTYTIPVTFELKNIH